MFIYNNIEVEETAVAHNRKSNFSTFQSPVRYDKAVIDRQHIKQFTTNPAEWVD